MIKLLNTVICYDNPKEVINYVNILSTLKCANEIAVCIIINKLDNENESKFKQQLNQISIKTFVCKPNKNLGYLNGMLYGYKKFIAQFEISDLKYIIMSNTDIGFPDKSFISKVLSKKYENNIWLIGPAVYVPQKNTYDNPSCIKRRTKKTVKRIIAIFKTPIIKELYIWASDVKSRIRKRKRGNSQYVYAVHGCFFLVSKDLANAMLEKPFRALLYSEEAYVSEMTYHAGKKAYYDADLLVEHNEHSVTGKLNYSRLAFYIAESMKIILQDFYQE